MAEITGSQAGETLAGTATDDLIIAFTPGLDVSSIVGTRIAEGLAKPIAVAAPPDDSGRLFILERDGLLKVMDLATGAIAPTPALDLTGQIAITGERGLLGLAFHPDFAANGRFFVFLSQPEGTSEIREYRLGADGIVVPGSARTILEIPQPPAVNHKGGWIGFGPDGMLYATSGDGGGGGDPNNNAQNLDLLLGKVLRIDVDGDDFAADDRRNYAIPDDNPFAATAGLDEIFAYGLRNPFRAGFDLATGRLFVGDVGQNAREEINIVGSGDNLGWRLYEGNAPYPPGSSAAPTDGLVFPIHDYTHESGDGRSVTGGTVYRGPSEALHGQYIFGDFASGRIFALDDTDGDGTWTRTQINTLVTPTAGALQLPAAFATAPDGALLVVDYGGEVFRLDPVAAGPADGADRVRAGAGRDIAYAGGGDDTVLGGEGGDTLYGMDGNDRLFGEGEADRLSGAAGRDTLWGGAGNDTLDGGAGDDLLAGGAGDDLYLADGQGDRVSDTAGADTVIAADTFRLFAGIETLVLAEGAGAAGGTAAGTATRIIGNASANRLVGLGGDDTLEGGVGADLLDGGSGRDRLVGGAGTDTLRGGAGDDTLLVDSRGDRVLELPGGGVDTVIAAGVDGYRLGSGIEVLVLDGAARLGVGNAGNNSILGSDGADRLYGLAGDDWIEDGAGNDTIWGGAGADAFFFDDGDGDNVVADFDSMDTVTISTQGFIEVEAIATGFRFTFGSGDSLVLNRIAGSTAGGSIVLNALGIQTPDLPGGGLGAPGGGVTLQGSGLPPSVGGTLAATGSIGLSTGGTIGILGASLSLTGTGSITVPGITLTGDTVL
jgi:glucose/arabinose dehydrogenase